MRTALLALCLFGFCVAEMTLYNQNGYYPYVVHEPEGGLAKPWPVIMFLHGSGSRADNDFVSHAQWDGVGWLLGRYNRGVRGVSETVAAQKFLSLLPVARLSNGMDWKNDELMNVINQVKSKYGNSIDWNRFYVSGFSMGAFGTWRFISGHPELVAAALPSAGYLSDGDINKVSKLPINYFCSDADDKVPGSKCQDTYNRLLSTGNKVSNFTRYPSSKNIPHSNGGNNDMSTVPFTAQNLQWLLGHSGTGGSSSTTGGGSSGSGGGSSGGGGQGNKGVWQTCSSSSECQNKCCSGEYSGGVLKCTPGSSKCV